MSRRRRVEYLPVYDPPPRREAAVSAGVAAVCAAVVAGTLGYLVGAQQSQPRAESPVPVATPAATAPVAADQELQAYRTILASDPKNVRAAVELANRLYDAGRYGEAIPYYQQAFALKPDDISVSTDLGTALWYAGRADDALAQYAKSLALNASHPQTLFNVGIVKRDGTRDFAGAIAAWEELLRSNPTYADAAKVKQFISKAREALLGGITPMPSRRS